MSRMPTPVGLVLGSHIPPEQIPALSARAEAGGFRQIWLAEDYFFTGGIAGVMAALDATSTIGVGLGVVSALARHPAALAMEIATASRLHPGRVSAGIGLGAPVWVRQMGLLPRSPLTAMREAVVNVRRLLGGEQVSFAGDVFHFDAVQLTHLPGERIPLHMGVIGPKMLRLSGEIADGTLVSATATAEYVRWLRERVAEGGAGPDHRVTTFALYSVAEDSAQAKQALRPTAAFYLSLPPGPLTDVYGITDELTALQAGGVEAIARELPDAWMEDMVIAGDPDECAAKIQRLLDAGSDAVALFPAPPEDTTRMIDLTASEVLPKVMGP